ncbi:MAG: hypothetical protein WC539_11200, partial [Nitrospirota bacterium]
PWRRSLKKSLNRKTDAIPTHYLPVTFNYEATGYDGVIMRPPSEAASLILQYTIGCSHNQCVFCPAYKQKQFRIRSIQEMGQDIIVSPPVWKDTHP